MNKRLDQAWKQAEQNPGQAIDIGGTVCCDSCSTDFTESDALGGFLFGSYAICPTCTPDWEANAKRWNETNFIKEHARPGESFHAFVMRIRNGVNTIRISKL